MSNLLPESIYQNNISVLKSGQILYVYDNGELDSISKYNLIGRVILWIRNLWNGSIDKGVNAAFLRTLEQVPNDLCPIFAKKYFDLAIQTLVNYNHIISQNIHIDIRLTSIIINTAGIIKPYRSDG